MADRSKIEWTDSTWNPIVGCTRVSSGCDNCYAIRGTRRLQHLDNHAGLLTDDGADWSGEVRLIRERLGQPSRWKRPRRIFVCSMSDLFHPDVSLRDIFNVWEAMANAPQHTFQVLTKRSREMREYFDGPACERITVRIAVMIRADRRLRKVCPIEPFPDGEQIPWPPPNVHLPAGCWTGRNGTRCHDHFVDADEMML